MFYQNNEIIFLTEEQIIEIHNSCIVDFGGAFGVRDSNILKSAVYQPQITFDGEYLYKTIPEMAAAYLISLSKDHPFIDGNKRVGFKACTIFLEMNNYILLLNNDEAVDLTLKCLSGEYSKEDIVRIIVENTIH